MHQVTYAVKIDCVGSSLSRDGNTGLVSQSGTSDLANLGVSRWSLKAHVEHPLFTMLLQNKRKAAPSWLWCDRGVPVGCDHHSRETSKRFEK